MTTHAIVKRLDGAPGKLMLGDVTSVGVGTFDRFKALRVRQSDHVRVLIVADSDVEFWAPLLCPVNVGNKLVLRRHAFLDILALEEAYKRKLGRLTMVPDEILHVAKADILEFTRERNVPDYPGVLR